MTDFTDRHPPSLKSPSRGFFINFFQFLALFIFFFTLSLTIVMFPTLLTRVSYLLGLQEKPSLTASLPFVADRTPSELEKLLVAERVIPQDDRIIIPQISVDAPVIYSQSSDNAALMEDLKKGVIHYPGTAYPGQKGNVFITGHSSYYWWSGGKYNRIFANLDKLENGDLVYLYRNGEEYIYQVYDSFVVKPQQVEILATTAEPTLTLMTCTPLGTNLRRLVVRAQLISLPSGSEAQKGFERIPQILPLQ